MGGFQELAEAEARQLADWEERVEALIREKGGSVSAREFQRVVNVEFHDVEANSYDKLHQEMWLSLPLVFDRLANAVERLPLSNQGWTVADVGCGTGLSTALLLRSPLGKRISQLKLIDTSPEMLKRCRSRAAEWPIPSEFICGQVEELPEQSVDLVITCSVLHHLPELFDFCRQLERVIKPGGFYLHVHDPRRGAAFDPIVEQRSQHLADLRRQRRRRLSMLPLRIARALYNKTRRLLMSDYLDEVNKRLIDAGLIKLPLAPNEIWSITDLRHGELPYSAVDGIDSAELQAALPNFRPVSQFTYGYYGVLPSNLPAELAVEERRLFAESSPDGMFVSGAWQRVADK